MAAHRLLSSDDVDPTALLMPHIARTAAACNGRRVVAVQDTTEINFDRRRRPASGLGPTGNDEIRGFFVHPVVAVDADDEVLLGVAGARIWTRGEEPTPNHNDIPFDEKESRRWLEGAELAATHLAPVATQVVMVADREGDIYPLFARRPEAIDFVVRANHNRVLAEGGNAIRGAGILASARQGASQGRAEAAQQQRTQGKGRPESKDSDDQAAA
jgi:hypothetical protein